MFVFQCFRDVVPLSLGFVVYKKKSAVIFIFGSLYLMSFHWFLFKISLNADTQEQIYVPEKCLR